MRTHRCCRRRGFTAIDLLVILVIFAFLVGVLLPAVQGAQQAAARAQSANNMKQIVLGLHGCNDVYKKLPPAIGWYPMSAGQARTQPGWYQPAWHGTMFYHLLPFVEEAQIYKNTTGSSWTSTGTKVKTFIAPNDPTAPKNGLHFHNRGAVSYGINTYALIRGNTAVGEDYDALGYTGMPRGSTDSQTTLPRIMTRDGTSNTIAIGERFATCWSPIVNTAGRRTGWRKFERVWGESSQQFNNLSPAIFRPLNKVKGRPFMVPPELRPEFGVDMKSCEPGTWQSFDGQIIQMGLFDGSVRGISSRITHFTWSNALRPDDGFALGPDW